ncbi:hypothetical protein GQ42DRAFT_164223 [Ramicandelaber brevisporus]|nr:hypothetical protein GQ42DRAFT_164223 [Ramicandelaber brevisporus]
MFYATRYALQAAVKKTTGIYGLAVHPDPRPHLISIYKQTLEALDTHSIPKTAAYRQATEAFTRQRLSVVEKTTDVLELELKLDAGQIEEVIKAAETELELIPKVAEWKIWEPLVKQAPAGQWEYFTAAKSN